MVEFLVTVPGGTGGGYYIDGVQKPIIPVVTGGTFRFNQNDSTNNFHPLILSTTTSSGGIISTGVSYYLDGPSNESDYRNTSLFNAASVRYIEITVTQTLDFYYLCSVHGFSMGNIMDVTVDTWGALNWGDNSWSSNTVPVSLTGLSLSSTLGTISITAELNQGWGRLTWGENAWGAGGDVVLQGQQLTSSINSVTPQAGASVQPTGISASFSLPGTVTFDIGALVILTGISATATAGAPILLGDVNLSITGSSATTDIGSVTVDARIETGWGRGTWGNRAWGDAYSVIAQGQELTSAQGTVIPRTDVSVTAASQQLLTITQGIPSILSDVNLFVFVGEPGLSSTQGTTTETGTANLTLTGIPATLSQGNTVGGTIQGVAVTGISASLTLGTFTLVQSTNEPVTGQAMTLGLGTPAEIPQQIVGVTGQQLTSGIGSVSVTGTGAVPLTGITLTSNIGSINITAWAEIDLGVNNVWTEVDLAA